MTDYDIADFEAAWLHDHVYRVFYTPGGVSCKVNLKTGNITYDHASGDHDDGGRSMNPDAADMAFAKAVFVADSRPEMDMELLRDALDVYISAGALREALVTADNGAPQNATESPQTDTQNDMQPDAQLAEADESADGHVAKVRTWLDEAGVPVGDGVSVYAHDEYDSVQIDKDDYMDGGWDELMKCVSHDAVHNAPDDYLWYVPFEDVDGVVG